MTTTAPLVRGLDLQQGTRVPFRRVVAWAFWDWGSASFNAVVTTFVFTVYLTSTKGFGDTDTVSVVLGAALAVAGVLVALIAPITGQRSDGRGRRKFWLAVNTAVVIVCIAGLYFVSPSPTLLWLGVALLAIGTVFYEIAGVNYNAMLLQVSTPTTVGRVSGFGWAMGYFGGIVLLLILYFGFIHPDVGLFGVTSADGLSVRVSMLIAALWFLLSALPILLAVPEYRAPSAAPPRPRVGFFRSYAVLGRDIATLWRESRRTVWFLLASAIFRDGLTGVFTFGGVLAAGTFGFSAGEVIIFAVAANVVAGLSTVLVGTLDDRVGPKPVIVAALVGLLVSGLFVFFLHDGGQIVFWTAGLALCLFVGPAQSASRTFLSRLAPAGREGEVFGLYATTGRAATFLAPALFSLCITIFGAQYWGILGILVVLLAGLAILIPVRSPERTAAADAAAPEPAAPFT
ncbi:MFS transporter [Pseudolysinimonas sp.]|uniref:MFS transporter n=1 Tax=Pseudolysinimonas sp. TaxID=2680009 RepID=UPI003F807E2B